MAGPAFFYSVHTCKIIITLNLYRYIHLSLEILLFQNIIALCKDFRVWACTHIFVNKDLQQPWAVPVLSSSGTPACSFGMKDSVNRAVHVWIVHLQSLVPWLIWTRPLWDSAQRVINRKVNADMYLPPDLKYITAMAFSNKNLSTLSDMSKRFLEVIDLS